jgi:phage shock protein PspC (stress-responsive transcriptional regulator)
MAAMTTPGDDIAPPPDPPDPLDPPASPDPAADPAEVPPPPPPSDQRLGLVRTVDRYAGGVAGGVARALDVDPIVVRLALAVGTLYFPVLVVLYALAWLVLPDERTGTSLLRSVRSGDDWRPVAGIVVLAVGATMLAPDLGPGAGDQTLTAGVLLAGAGLLLLLRRPVDGPPPAPGFGGGPAGPGSPAPMAPPPVPVVRPPRPLRRRPRRPPSPLGWFGLSALVVLVGVAAGIDRGVTPVQPGVAVSLGLLLLGAVLLVAARWGRARLLVLAGVPLLPLWVGWTLTDVPRYEDDGGVSYVVTQPDQLRRSYVHGFGVMDIDLHDLALEPGEHRAVHLGLTGGTVRLQVPADADVVIDGDIGLGEIEMDQQPYFGRIVDTGLLVDDRVDLHVRPRAVCTLQDSYGPPTTDELGNYQEGEVTRDHRTPYGEPCQPKPPPKDPSVLELTLDVGIGTVEVHRESA